jgi:hypothetical protein
MKAPEHPCDLPEFEAWRKREPICLQCGSTLPKGFIAACGLKTPCPVCHHPYPLGDCSD